MIPTMIAGISKLKSPEPNPKFDKAIAGSTTISANIEPQVIPIIFPALGGCFVMFFSPLEMDRFRITSI
jgi:hypothetical protein